MSRAKLIHVSGRGLLPQPYGGEMTYVLVLDKGLDAIGDLLGMSQQLPVSTSHFTAMGGFDRVTLGFFDRDRGEYKKVTIEEPVEVLSLVGNIVYEGEEPKVHAHVVVGKSDGTAHGGHLLEARVSPILEVVLVESPRHLQRKLDKKLGLALISLQGIDTVKWKNLNAAPVTIEIRKGDDSNPLNNRVVASPTISQNRRHTETSEGEDFFWKRINPPGDGTFNHRVCRGSGQTFTEEV